jgi:mono/diheme cytochrome c family protein
MMHPMKKSFFHLTCTAACACWILAFAAASTTSTVAAEQKTSSDGVYTAAQADRGEGVFKDQCASCHAPGDFTADDFLKKWAGKPLHALFDTVSSTMPMDNPGTLKPQQYADVISYFLKLNKFPSGSEELKGTADAMKAITFAKKAAR